MRTRQLREEIWLLGSEGVSKGGGGKRKNYEQENCSLNPPANPSPQNKVKSVRPAEHAKKTGQTFQFLLSFLPLSILDLAR